MKARQGNLKDQIGGMLVDASAEEINDAQPRDMDLLAHGMGRHV
jgi:hypothetical protein